MWCPQTLLEPPSQCTFCYCFREFVILPPKTRFGGEIWGFHLHFGDIGWNLVLLGKSGALAGRGPQTPTKPMGFIGILRSQSLIFGEFHVKWWFILKFARNSQVSMFLREKVEKSCNRTPGWFSRKAAKVLRLIRVRGGYLRPGVEFSKISPF